ncbi:MAG TPA: HEAT repeat domain-containing protein [Allosphingosinicella sp.]|nr:HEAT repeat domain-containing protein [Allosphingosinicella sp.]
MIAGHALSDWLNDRSAQAATLDRLIGARAAWHEAGDLDTLTARLDAAERDAGEVAAIARDLVADDRLPRHFLATMLGGLSADSFFTPPLRHMPGAVGHGVRLFSHRCLTLSLVVLDADALAAKKQAGSGGRAIVFTGRLALRRMLRAGGAAIERFTAEPAGDDFCLSEQPPCRIVGREPLADGDLLEVDGRRESFTFLHAGSAIAFMECEVLAGGAPFRVDYDAETLEAVAASSTDEAASRCQLMLSALRALDGAPETPLYDTLLGDRSFEVRWHTIRELMRVDPKQAWPRLRRMAASDSNREVRAAASRAVAARAERRASCRA